MVGRVEGVKESPLGRNAHLLTKFNRRPIGRWFREEILAWSLHVRLFVILLGIIVLWLMVK